MDNKKILFVGIIEERQYTIELLRELLIFYGYQLNYNNVRNNIQILNKGINELVLVSMRPNKVEEIESFGIEYDFLIINIKDYDFSNNNLFKKQFKQCDYYIINSDEDNLNQLSLESLEGIAITFGFNKKATMTISSYLINQVMEASLCLQREIITLKGDRVVPFEFIIELNSENKEYIYSALATSCLMLTLGEKMLYKNFIELK